MSPHSPRPNPSRRTSLCTLASSAVVAWSALLPIAAHAESTYTLGIVPYFSPSRLEEIYAPAAAELAHSLGRGVSFRTSTTWDKFYAQLKAQTYDIVFVHALFYVPAADEFGYLPLARMREPFTAVVVVPDKSPVQKLDDLRDKVIATPPTYLPTVHLAKKALRDRGFVRGRNVTFEETRTVDACLQAALVGAAQACIAPPFAASAFQVSAGVRMRVVLESAELPSPVFMVHKRVPEPERERLRAALLGWNNSPAGNAVLRSINTRALVTAADRDYDPVRAFVRTLDEPWLPSVP